MKDVQNAEGKYKQGAKTAELQQKQNTLTVK
jgi:hypothetical protein